MSMELIVCAMLGSGVSRAGGDRHMVYIWGVCFRFMGWLSACRCSRTHICVRSQNTVTVKSWGAWAIWTCDYMALDATRNVAVTAMDPGFPPASL